MFQLRQVFGFPCHEVGEPPGGCWHSGASVVAGMAAMAAMAMVMTDLGVMRMSWKYKMTFGGWKKSCTKKS
jgi:hypothetical protein